MRRLLQAALEIRVYSFAERALTITEEDEINAALEEAEMVVKKRLYELGLRVEAETS